MCKCISCVQKIAYSHDSLLTLSPLLHPALELLTGEATIGAYKKAKNRWESIITGNLPSRSSRNFASDWCTLSSYPTTIDDTYICGKDRVIDVSVCGEDGDSYFIVFCLVSNSVYQLTYYRAEEV